MELFTIGSGKKRDVTEADIIAAFADDRARGEGLYIADDDGALLSASGEGFGPYTLEYFASVRRGTHLRATEQLKKDEAKAALLDFWRGENWREAFDWRVVEDGPTSIKTLVGATRGLAIVGLFIGSVFCGSKVIFSADGGSSTTWALAGVAGLVSGALLVWSFVGRPTSSPGGRSATIQPGEDAKPFPVERHAPGEA